MNGFRQVLEALRGLLVWWVTITPWERGLRVRLGSRIAMLGPGIHLRVPIVDRVYRQSVRRRSAIQPAQTLITRDGKPLTVAVTITYQIADLRLLYDTLHHPEGTLQAIVLGAVGRWVVEHEAGECSPAALCAAVPTLINLERFGLSGTEVSVITFAFVRTFRFITGDGHGWQEGGRLDTEREDNDPRGGY